MRHRQEIVRHPAACWCVNNDSLPDGVLDGRFRVGQLGAHLGWRELVQIAVMHAVRLDRHAHGRHLAQGRPVQKARLAHHRRIDEEFGAAAHAGDFFGGGQIAPLPVIEGQADGMSIGDDRLTGLPDAGHPAAVLQDELQLVPENGR